MGKLNLINHEILKKHLLRSINEAPVFEDPFFFICIKDVFPSCLYEKLIKEMPHISHYRNLPGHNNENLRADGSSTRAKMHLLPEYVKHLSTENRELWSMVVHTLISEEVKEAFRAKLLPGMEPRFGAYAKNVSLYPIPILTRDTSGYRIHQHTDTFWKVLTIQIYLPSDMSDIEAGTIFHKEHDHSFYSEEYKVPFTPNSGYAFAVSEKSWHSARIDKLNADSRNTILLTYFLDVGVRAVLKNRINRIGNYLRDRVVSSTKKLC